MEIYRRSSTGLDVWNANISLIGLLTSENIEISVLTTAVFSDFCGI